MGLHKVKKIMDTTSDPRVYNLARRTYLDSKEDGRRVRRPYIETGLRKLYFHHVKGKKKRKWLKPRKLEKLKAPLPNDTYVLVKNPSEVYKYLFPVSPGDFTDDDTLGLIKGFLPPGEEVAKSWRDRYTEPAEIPSKNYKRVRRYRVKLLFGSFKGKTMRYDEDWIRVVDPADLPQLLFVMRIRALNGQI